MSGETQTTYYGYEKPGDPDYDSASAAGIGDRDNRLSDSADHHSVALTQSERLARFGVTGHSTGQAFEYEGAVYYDDDTAPESNRRVDIYSPSGPGPDSGPGSGYQPVSMEIDDESGMSAEQLRAKYGSPLPSYYDTQEAELKEQPEQKPDEPTQSPLDAVKTKLKDKYPEIDKMSDDDILSKYLQPAFPNVPVDKLTTYAKNPQGAKLLQEEEERDETPLERFKVKFPKFVEDKTDDEIIDYLHTTLEPSMPMDQFKDKVNPWKGSDDSIKNLISNSAHNFVPSALAKVQEDSASLWGLMSGDLEKSIVGTFVGPEGMKKIDEWRDNNLGNLDFLKDFVNWMGGNKQALAASAEENNKKIQKGWSGYAGRLAGSLAGNLPMMAATYGYPGSGAGAMAAAESKAIAESAGLAERQSATYIADLAKGEVAQLAQQQLIGDFTKRTMAWAASLGTAKGYVKAYEEGAKYPILNAVKDGAVDATAAWMFNSGSGWIASGLGNILLNMDEDKLKAYMSGDKNEVWSAITGTAIDAIFGASWGFEHGAWGNLKMPDAAKADLELARKARTENIAKAKDLVDRAFALMPEDLQHQIVSDVIKVTQEGARNAPEGDAIKVKKIETPSDKPVDLSDFRLRQEHGLGETHFEPDESLNKPYEYEPGVPEPESGLKHDPYKTPKPSFEATLTYRRERPEPEKPEPEKPKAKPEKPKRGPKPKQVAESVAKTKTQKQVEEQLGKPLDTAEQLAKAHQEIKGKMEETIKGKKPAETKEPEKPAKPTRAPDPKTVWVDHMFYGAGHVPRKKGKLPGDRGQLGAAIDPIEIIREMIKWDSRITHEIVPNWFGKQFLKIPGVKEGRKSYFDTFPELKSEESMQAASRIGKANSLAEWESGDFQNEIFRKNNFQEELMRGDLAARRSGYQKKFTRSQQLEMLMLAEEGKPTGDPIMDRMAEIRREGYKILLEAQEELGMVSGEKDNYMYHIWDDSQIEEYNKEYTTKFGKPTFLHPREFETYRAGMAAARDPVTGKPRWVPKTLDQEMIFGIRVWDFKKNQHIIYTLRDWENQGKAWSTTDPDLPPDVKEWPVVRSPSDADGSFHVQPDAYNVMKVAWFPPREGLEAALGAWGTFLKWTKSATTPLRFADSIAHEMHMGPIRLGQRWAHMLSNPKGYSPKQWAELAYLDTATLGYGRVVKDYLEQRSLLDLLQNRRSMKTATPQEQWLLSQLLDSGFSAKMSHEREVEFGNWLRENTPKWTGAHHLAGPADVALGIGSNWILMQGVQKWAFGRMIPGVKVATMLEKIKNAYEKQPELLDPKNNTSRLVVLRALQQKVDKRLGEVNFNNVFWSKALKDCGIGSLLAMGWDMGIIDYYGGMVKVLTGNKFHLENVKDLYVRRAGKDLRWDALRVAATYTMSSMLQGAVVNYVNTGQPPTDWRDYFNPKSGRKNADGTDQRLNTLNWPAEAIGLYEYIQNKGSVAEGTAEMARHKLNPTFSSLVGSWFNTDYLGRFIRKPDDEPIKQVLDTITGLIKDNFTPMSSPAYAHLGQQVLKGKATWQDTKEAINSMLGFTRASQARERNPLENKIMDQFQQQTGHGRLVDEINELHFEYKQAADYQDKEGMAEAIRKMKAAHLSHEQIQNVIKNTLIPSAKRIFKRINSKVQAKDLMEMTPAERKEYLPFASKKGIQAFKELQKMAKHPKTGLYMPESPQHALTLAPGTKFTDPEGNTRMVPQYA